MSADSLSVLLLGSSTFTFTETDRRSTLPAFVEEALSVRDSSVSWRCYGQTAFETENVVEKALAYARRYHADAVIYDVSTFRFLHEAVIYRVRNRWPRAYPAVLKLSELAMRAGDGTFNGTRNLRGAIFRLPKRVAQAMIGADVDQPLDVSVQRATEAIDALLRLEDVAVIVSMPKFYWRVPGGRERLYRERVSAARALLSGYCQKRRIPTYDLVASMIAAGLSLGLARDQLHHDVPTLRYEAEMIAHTVCAALEVGSAART